MACFKMSPLKKILLFGKCNNDIDGGIKKMNEYELQFFDEGLSKF